MAAKRKSRAGGHRKHHRRATNRTHTHYARHTRRKSVFARSRNRRNPSVHRRVHHYMRHRRRRNPSSVSGKEVLYFAGAGIALAIVQPFVGNVVGGVAGNLLGNFTSPAITALTGYGLGWLAGKVHATKEFERPLMILGLSTAVIQIVQPYVSNLIGGAAARPAPAAGMSGPWPHSYSNWNKWNPGLGRHRRMRGIGVVTAVPPMIVAPSPVAAPPAAAGATNGAASSAPTGMQGFGMRPGVWAH